jgi:hypothetical protein
MQTLPADLTVRLQQSYLGGGLMASGGPNGGGGGWQKDLQHLWSTLLGQLPGSTQPLLKAVRRSLWHTFSPFSTQTHVLCPATRCPGGILA